MGNLLHYAIVFLVVALVAALFGFGGITARRWKVLAYCSGSRSFSTVIALVAISFAEYDDQLTLKKRSNKNENEAH